MEKTDIEKLRALPIESVAERLGLTVSRHKTLCPYHADSHPSLSFSPKANTFRCFACGAHGGVIDIAMHVLGKDFIDTCRWLADEHNVIIDTGNSSRQQSASQCDTTFDAMRYQRFFEHPFLTQLASDFLFEKRRIDPRVVGWCRLTGWKEWLQIPYYGIDGTLTGVQWRYLGTDKQQPRFRFMKGSRCGIYNLTVLKLLKHDEPLYVAEGPSDCWALLSAGHKAIAIPSATLLGRSEKAFLKDWVDKHGPLNLHMYPDADIPGEKLYIEMTSLATDIGSSLTRHSLPPGCKDFAEHYVNLQNNKH